VERVGGGAPPCPPLPARDCWAGGAPSGAPPPGAPRRASSLARLAAAEAGVPAARGAAAPSPSAAAPPPPLPPPARRHPPPVLALDIAPMEPLPGARVVRADFLNPATRPALLAALLGGAGASGGGADTVLSDMAHSFCGKAGLDHTRQMALSWGSLLFACEALAQGGAWVCKVRQGEEYGALRAEARARFASLREVKPPSSRADSAEAFLVGTGYIGERRGAPWGPAAQRLLAQHGLVG
jgi:23S rRNA U2552 (ribose-2'-O)-methylase RlmE/FtsJ